MTDEPVRPKDEKTTFYRIKKTLSVFGIEVSRGTRHPVHLTKVFFYWVLGGIGLSLLGSVGVYEYSTQPSFCNSCHIMSPYYNAWKTSKHEGKAGCVDCHYPPPKTPFEHMWHKFQASAQVVKYITRTYSSKPFADVPDESCLRSGCHSNRLLEGKITTTRGIKFDHRPHLTEQRRGRQLRCVSCHSQIVVGKHIEVTYDTCFLCHFREGRKGDEPPNVDCAKCHETPTQSFKVGNMSYNHKDFVESRGVSCRDCHLDITGGDGKAKQDRCFTCHNQPEKLSKYDDIPFIHENHVTKHHVACLHCHDEIRHRLSLDIQAGLEASPETQPESHPGAETQPETVPGSPPILAFECNYCHQKKHIGQVELYTGDATSLGVPKMPSPMYLANVDCVGCHYRERPGERGNQFSGTNTEASEQACIKCHGPTFKGIWQEVRSELTSVLAKLEEKSQAAGAALKSNTALSEEDRKAAEKSFGQAQKIQQFLKAGHGEHNIYLASVLLRKEDEALGAVGSKTGATLADLSKIPLLSGTYCADMCHKTLGVKVPPETVPYDNGRTMPHQMHIETVGSGTCVACHELGGHKRVPLIKGTKEGLCKGCHN